MEEKYHHLGRMMEIQQRRRPRSEGKGEEEEDFSGGGEGGEDVVDGFDEGKFPQLKLANIQRYFIMSIPLQIPKIRWQTWKRSFQSCKLRWK